MRGHRTSSDSDASRGHWQQATVSWAYLFNIYEQTAATIRDHFMEGELFVHGNVARVTSLFMQNETKVKCACMVARHFPHVEDHQCKVLTDWETCYSSILSSLYESTYKEVCDYDTFVFWMWKNS